jgi:lysyl-tRNA synthetase class 2
MQMLRERAALVDKLRGFFAKRGVLEVDTPMLSCAGTVDRNIDSFEATGGRWLQTSPEFAMKRLVAAGSGPIFQIAHVFRIDEAGRHHNPEFSMLEWYRPGWDHRQLMTEVAALLGSVVTGLPAELKEVSYRAAFINHAGVDPLESGTAGLQRRCKELGIELVPTGGNAVEQRDFYLDLLMSKAVGPALGRDAPEFLYDFPASQAALARIRADDPPVAERFELFWKGIELANGFHELNDAREQRRRFERDREARGALGLPTPEVDEHLLAALESGLPDCAGVAVGIDRLLMLMQGLDDVRDTFAFDWMRA